MVAATAGARLVEALTSTPPVRPHKRARAARTAYDEDVDADAELDAGLLELQSDDAEWDADEMRHLEMALLEGINEAGLPAGKTRGA